LVSFIVDEKNISVKELDELTSLIDKLKSKQQ
jgi:hypothetical protein